MVKDLYRSNRPGIANADYNAFSEIPAIQIQEPNRGTEK